MGDGLQRADDYANSAIAPFLRDVKRSGTWEVTDRYLLAALGWKIDRRDDIHSWVERFAARHGLIFERDDKQERYKFIRARF